MNFKEAIPYVIKIVDTALHAQDCIGKDVARLLEGKKCKLVGWQCGFEPTFVAVVDAYDCDVDDDEAECIATDYLREAAWFNDAKPDPADFIIGR